MLKLERETGWGGLGGQFRTIWREKGFKCSEGNPMCVGRRIYGVKNCSRRLGNWWSKYFRFNIPIWSGLPGMWRGRKHLTWVASQIFWPFVRVLEIISVWVVPGGRCPGSFVLREYEKLCSILYAEWGGEQGQAGAPSFYSLGVTTFNASQRRRDMKESWPWNIPASDIFNLETLTSSRKVEKFLSEKVLQVKYYFKSHSFINFCLLHC